MRPDRCYQLQSTGRFILGNRPFFVVDRGSGKVDRFEGLRGNCAAGIGLGNGLVYNLKTGMSFAPGHLESICSCNPAAALGLAAYSCQEPGTDGTPRTDGTERLEPDPACLPSPSGRGAGGEGLDASSQGAWSTERPRNGALREPVLAGADVSEVFAHAQRTIFWVVRSTHPPLAVLRVPTASSTQAFPRSSCAADFARSRTSPTKRFCGRRSSTYELSGGLGDFCARRAPSDHHQPAGSGGGCDRPGSPWRNPATRRSCHQ